MMVKLELGSTGHAQSSFTLSNLAGQVLLLTTITVVASIRNALQTQKFEDCSSVGGSL